MSKLRVFKDIFQFVRLEKKYVVGPIALVLILLGVLFVFAESSVIAPFIYSLF